MTNPSDMAFSFEAVLLGATKDKNGYVVKLVIHPSDVPDELVRDLVGTRYQIAAVRLKDNGQPDGKKAEAPAEVKHAALLCKNPNFWKFMAEVQGSFGASEAEATEQLRVYLGVESRSELKTSERARRRFHTLVAEYEKWLE